MAEIVLVEVGPETVRVEAEFGVEAPPEGWNVVWAERWDEAEDCASGLCRDCGRADALDEAMAMAEHAGVVGASSGWKGRAYVTDACGRRAGAPVPAAA